MHSPDGVYKDNRWKGIIGLTEIRIFFLMIPPIARIAQLVERDLAKVEVAGSNPVSRSIHGFSRNFPIYHFSLRK